MRGEAKDKIRLVFRGMNLGKQQFTVIQRLIDAEPRQTRQQIARETCHIFCWRTPGGTLAIRSCRELLVRLDQAGVIRLPAPSRSQGRPQRPWKEQLCYQEKSWQDFFWQLPAGDEFVVRPITKDEELGWRVLMEHHHYLGDSALVGESIRYAAFSGGKLIALLSWGTAALHNRARDCFLGWREALKRSNLYLVLNNHRFLMLESSVACCPASRVLGTNLRRLRQDWQALYGHDVVLAETFVDRSRFQGTCYRASNWSYVGDTQGWSKSGNTYSFHGRPKSVWLYPLTDDYKRRLCSTGCVRGRREGLMNLDVGKLPLHGHGGLFEVLEGITDHRKRRGIRHEIKSILGVAICATLAGAGNITAIAEWAAEQSRETMKLLGSKRGGTPSERTLRRVLLTSDAEEVERVMSHWMQKQQQSLSGMAVSIDGKTLRGSRNGNKKAVHLLSALVHGSGIVVGQTEVDIKTNEITRVEPLFEDIDLKGAVVTADALLTQKNVAKFLVKEKGADFVFTVKNNQQTLREDIEALLLDGFSPRAHDH